MARKPVMSGSQSHLVHFLQDGTNLFDGPVELRVGDDQRRCEPDDCLVRFLAQETPTHQPFTNFSGAAESGVYLDADEQAGTADLAD